MRESFRERLILYMVTGIFSFSVIFVLLWVLAPEFSATGGTIAGIVLGIFLSGFVSLTGGEVVRAALTAREVQDKDKEIKP